MAMRNSLTARREDGQSRRAEGRRLPRGAGDGAAGGGSWQGRPGDDSRQGPPPPSRAGTAPVVVRALLGLSRLVLVTLGAREGHRRGGGETERACRPPP